MTGPIASRLRATAAYWGFALFLIVVAGTTGSWFIGADLVRERIAMMAETVVAEGGSFAVQSIEVTGFPFAFDTKVAGLRVTGRTPRGMWEWQAERVAARLSPWRTGGIAFDLAGTHRLRFRIGRLPLDLEIDAREAPGEFREAAGDAPRLVKVALRRLSVREAVTGRRIEAESATVQLYRYPGGDDSASEASAGVLVDVTGAVLPEGAEKLLGRDLAKLNAEVQVLGEMPVPVERSVLSRWRRGGGALEIKNLDLAWGPSKVTGSGTVTLDEGLQPEASFSASISGHDQTVEALVAAGLIREQEAQSVRLVLDMMSRRSGPGEEAVVRIPLSIQDRVFYVGPARLWRLPLVRW